MKKSLEKDLERFLSSPVSELAVTVKTSTPHTDKEKIQAKQRAFLDRLTASLKNEIELLLQLQNLMLAPYCL